MSALTRRLLSALIIAGAILCGNGCGEISPVPAPDTPENPDKPDTPDNPDNPDNPETPENPTSDYFRLVTLSDNTKDAESTLISDFNAGKHTLVAKTNLSADKWSASSDAEWCTPTKDGDLLVISYTQYGEKNDMVQPRSCKVKVKAGSVFSTELTIVQNSGRKQLSVYGSPSPTFYISPSGTPMEFIITTNQWDWKIENTSDWLTAEHVDRMTLRVKATPKQDSNAAKRKATIYLYSSVYKSFDNYVQGESYRMTFYDADADFSGEDYNYGENQNWDE